MRTGNERGKWKIKLERVKREWEWELEKGIANGK